MACPNERPTSEGSGEAGASKRNNVTSSCRKNCPRWHRSGFQMSCIVIRQLTLRQHTSVIILGDGRNNYGDPQLDILSTMARTCGSLSELQTIMGDMLRAPR